MTPPRPALVTAGLALAVVLAWLNGLLVRVVTVDVQFLGATADRGDYRVAAGAGVTTALLLVAGLVAVRSLGAPPWLGYLTAAALATQLAFGVTAWWSSRAEDNSVVVDRSAWDGVRDALLFPGAWPLLVVLVVALVVRARSSRSPR